jgi:hypothetical protein
MRNPRHRLHKAAHSFKATDGPARYAVLSSSIKNLSVCYLLHLRHISTATDHFLLRPEYVGLRAGLTKGPASQAAALFIKL